MTPIRRLTQVFIASMALFAVSLTHRTTQAHHEAILGPQSAAVMEGSGYLATQGFTKRTASSSTAQETSLLLSGGVTPFPSMPVAFSLSLPISIAGGERTRVGLENIFISTRLRLNFKDLQKSSGKEGNYVMFIAGVELPTGTMDQSFKKAPTNTLWGIVSSFEREDWGALAFVLTRLEGTNGDGLRKGHELLMGTGIAYTPLENSEQMASMQLGVSYEVGLLDHSTKEWIHRGGFERLMLTPATVIGVSPRVQLLGYGAIPILQRATLDDDRIRWRLGAGITYLLE